MSLLSCMHPILASMVVMDAESEGISVGWIINDAVAKYYDYPELESTIIYLQQKREKE